MGRVGLVVHPDRPLAHELAVSATAWLQEHGHEVYLPRDDAAVPGFSVKVIEDCESSLDLIVSLGGDGTMLRSVRLATTSDAPVLGVNVGHLGYLTEVEPKGLVEALSRYFAGDFQIEHRLLLRVTAKTANGNETLLADYALNEAVIEKTTSGHTVRLGVSLNGEYFTTYATDGLIVATPTGSTAYSFSARGPIVDPNHKALVLTPVAPHMLFDRSLVLDPKTVVSITVAPGHVASVFVDGRSLGEFEQGSVIHCQTSSHQARLVTFGLREFHAILKAKFGLPDR